MTSRSKNAVRSYETEIEKCREESNWKKVVELALQLKARSPQRESLAHFLIGEGKLEVYLEEWPPIKDNIERAQRELSEARGYLTLATDEAGKRDGVALDAHLLLGKLNYACGEYNEALKHFQQAELNTLTEKELPLRSLRVVAESYAIKGLCLEQNALPSSTSRFKLAEKENEMIRSFEVSSELSLLYLQRAGGAARAGPTLETALQRVPLLHIRAGRLQDAIDRYREMLTAVESPSTQALRLTLARQLAEVLLRGVAGQVYKAPVQLAPPPAGTLTRRREEYVSEGPWKPKKYAAINQFVPRNEYEEVMLVLLVGEAMAARDAVLSQSAEFEAARAHALRNAVAVADLLALAAARWGQLALLIETLERAMKFSFGCAHVWRQRALACVAAAGGGADDGGGEGAGSDGDEGAAGGHAPGDVARAHGVALHAAALLPGDAPARLVVADMHYGAGWIEEGISMAEEALRIEEQRDGPMLARCCLYCGIGHQMRAQKTNSRLEKDAENEQALKYLVRAVQLDDNDHRAFCHLAQQYMELGMLNEAMDATRACLAARAECGGGLRLCASLWARACAGRRSARALAAARLARQHHPRAAWPLRALAALQPPAQALQAGRDLLQLLQSAAPAPPAPPGPPARPDPDALSWSAAGSASAGWGAGRAGRALSEGGSERSTSGRAAPAPPRSAPQRAAAWLLLADIYLRLERPGAAASCVSEAAALTPYSHLVLHTRGRVHAAGGEWEEARQCFQNAIALHPTHLDSLVQLGAAYYALGWLRLAEKVLREAAQLQPARADTWRRLALVLGALGEPAAAADAAAAALALYPHAPALLLPALTGPTAGTATATAGTPPGTG